MLVPPAVSTGAFLPEGAAAVHRAARLEITFKSAAADARLEITFKLAASLAGDNKANNSKSKATGEQEQKKRLKRT